MRYAKSFFAFWQDFLIGDCPEVAVGVLAILGIALGLHSTGVLVAIIVPVAVLLLLAFSVRRGVVK